MQKSVFLIIFLFYLCVTSRVFGAPAKYRSYNKEERITITPIFGLSTKRYFRGALTWDAPVFFFGAGFNFYNKVALAQRGLSFLHNIGRHQLALGFSGFNDDRPKYVAFSLEDKEEDIKNSRADTFEIYLRYKYSLGFIVGTLAYYKDVNEHRGRYISSELILRLIPYTGINLKIGYADEKHNKFLYGPEAVSGVADLDFSLNWRFMILPKDGALMFSIGKNIIAQEKNRHAYYVDGQPTPWKASLMAMWIL